MNKNINKIKKAATATTTTTKTTTETTTTTYMPDVYIKISVNM